MTFSVQSGCHAVWDTCIVRQEESTIMYDVIGNEPMLYLPLFPLTVHNPLILLVHSHSFYSPTQFPIIVLS